MNTAAAAVHRHTPDIQAFDGRGLVVREVAYLRHPDDPQASSLITRHQWDARGFLAQSADPRLHESGLCNLRQHTDLAGQVLCTRSADAGVSLVLNDAARRPAVRFDHIRLLADDSEDQAEIVTRCWVYEDAQLPGRPLRLSEQAVGQDARISECFVYAGATPAEQALNLAGRCVRHYDPAGLLVTDQVALTGVPLSLTRFLLDAADEVETEVDWQEPEAFPRPDSPSHTSLSRTDASGAPLISTDAAGNRQRIAYDVAGQVRGRWLTLKDGGEQMIADAHTYDAVGSLLHEVHGNGVEIRQEYEAQTRRLTAIRVERPAGHPLGAALLQDLRYEYDPVGNVTRIDNLAESRRFWRNQEVLPESTYRYDSLYRLIQATGREMASGRWQGGRQVSGPVALDDATYTRYTRSYHYDSGANLTQIRHSAPAAASSHTVDITVSERSCRAVLSSLAVTPEEVDALFSAAGGQRSLQPGQALQWTPRAQLRSVVLATQEGRTTDHEHYRYDADSQRVLKLTRHANRTQRVLYLPGLELRSSSSGDVPGEQLQVIRVDAARVLHWTEGKPQDIDNDLLRYSYTALTGSYGLELDGQGAVISREEYYPYGGTAIWVAHNEVEVEFKTRRYSGKELDATGLYYFGYRYYQPWGGRWLSADPAATVDGLNLYCMVRNNPVSYFDDKGLMFLVPQPGEIQSWLSGYSVLASGLSQFAPSEANQLMSSLHMAHGVLDKVSRLPALPDAEMRTFFGADYQARTNDVVASWQRTGLMLSEYVSSHRALEKFIRVSGAQDDTHAEINPADFDGRVMLHDLFFDPATTDEYRAGVLIHEFTHLRRVSGVRSVGVASQDFFYLKDSDPAADSQEIVGRGRILGSNIEDVSGLFNEVARFNQWPVLTVSDRSMTHGQSQASQRLTRAGAVREFRKNPQLRTQVAVKNADNLAYAALAIARL
ncbi:RHS repeat-associated core domain-containing protein [Pseudomonas japonica]|uniref:RHS repeat-associated core domain-containing protein n=1 Tax=Pseudomonas japonica TaxID=256466 RepID=UPI0038278F10